MLVAIIICALGTVSKKFHLHLKKAGLDRSVITIIITIVIIHKSEKTLNNTLQCNTCT